MDERVYEHAENPNVRFYTYKDIEEIEKRNIQIFEDTLLEYLKEYHDPLTIKSIDGYVTNNGEVYHIIKGFNFRIDDATLKDIVVKLREIYQDTKYSVIYTAQLRMHHYIGIAEDVNDTFDYNLCLVLNPKRTCFADEGEE